MPLAGLALAKAFALEPLVATGLIVLAASPGGVMSNVLCHLGKADTALSITLTATATAVTLFTIPLWVRTALADFGEDAHDIALPVVDTALDLAGFTILPVAVGMLAARSWPGLAARESWITRASTAAMITALTIDALGRDDPPLEALGASWRPAVLLLGIALAIGLGVPLLAGLGWREGTTIAVELCIKNGVLALFVVTQALGSITAAVPVVVFMTFQVPAAIGILALYNFVGRRAERSERLS
jgi:BASS family bile acid:Na+ symporter